MTDIAKHWVKYYLEGDKNDYWAVEKLNEITQTDSKKAWAIIKEINSTKISGHEWQEFVDSNLGCGPLEEIISLDSGVLMDVILNEAKKSERLRNQLSMIYESSIDKAKWDKIQNALNM